MECILCYQEMAQPGSVGENSRFCLFPDSVASFRNVIQQGMGEKGKPVRAGFAALRLARFPSSPMLGWILVIQMSLSHLCSCK